MIKKINIKNFQSHKNSILEFNEGVNVIVGNSDSGKSAIIRALKWVVYNLPRGDAFRSHWGGDTDIEILTDKAKVNRIKTNSKNLYILKTDKQKLDFAAFGNDVPEEISQILNLDEINLQQQSDSPFLISNTPGEVSQHFNRMANLEKIDISMKLIQSEIRSIDQTITSKKVELKETQEKFKEYSYVADLEIDVVNLEKLESNKTFIKTNLLNITKILINLKYTQENIDFHRTILKPEQDIINIISLYEEKAAKNSLKKVLQVKLDKLETLESYIDEKTCLIDSEKLVDSLITLYEKKNKTKKKIIILKNNVLRITDINESISFKKDKIKQRQEIFDANMPDVCPLCNQLIKK